ncbi:MAG: fatty acid desaturase [Rickettsiales bacterium]
MPLIKRFYADRFLHIRSFSLSLFTGLVLCAALYAWRGTDVFNFTVSWWHALLIPAGIYVGGLSAVWIHNATHGSFKNKHINELCGQIAGVHQLWGFTGWKLIHLLHHMYSDNVEHDTHPPKGHTFWHFAKIMFVYSSACVSKRYREHWGDTAQTRFLQRAGLTVFVAMATTNLAFWFLLLGAPGFVFFYIPSYLFNHFMFVDINYSAHPVNSETGETAAANLNHNLYYKLANHLWHGIYFHGNHHRKPLLFNPRHMPARPHKTELKKAA